MEKVALPMALESLTFGDDFNEPMEKVALPSGLLYLEFARFNRSLEKVARSVDWLTDGNAYWLCQRS